MPAKKYPLEIIIGAIDKATAPFNRLNRQLEELNRPVKKLQKSFASLNRTLGMARLSRSLSNVRRSFGRVSDGFNTMFRRATMVGAAVGGMAAGIGFFAKRAGEMEQVRVSFETITGSAEAADRVIKDVTQFAATTPFELRGLLESSKQLMAFGVAEDAVVGKLRQLGDIASVFGAEKLPTLIRVFGRIKSKGRADLETLNMLIEAGIPIIRELSSEFKVGEAAIFQAISKGKISAEAFNRVLTKMTSKGGVAFEGMQKQSKTLFGLVSNVVDNFDVLAIAIGNHLLPALKPLAKQLTEFISLNRDMLAAKIGKPLADLVKMIPKAIPIVRREFETMKPVLIRIGEILKVVHEKFGVFKLGLIAIGAFVAGPFLLAINGLMVALIDLFAVVMTSPFGIILVGIVAWGSAIKSVIDDWKMLKATFLEAYNAIEPKLKWIADKLKYLAFLNPAFLPTSLAARGYSNYVENKNKIVDQNAPGGAGTRNANVKVTFDNLPPGARVTQEPGSQPVDLDLGYQMGIALAGG